uniref:Uncharacterized protein n=1 Tax=Anguilla anguilla TaxID=7936 RepID=A0A0E9WAC3_ANGAN
MRLGSRLLYCRLCTFTCTPCRQRDILHTSYKKIFRAKQTSMTFKNKIMFKKTTFFPTKFALISASGQM